MSIYIPSTISVSRKKPLDCEEMASYLSDLGIYTLIKSNTSTLPHKEYGCQLTQSVKTYDDIKNIWNPIKNKYGFTCAHISVANIYTGCILGLLEEKKCRK